MKTTFQLIKIENCHPVTKLSDCDFCFLIQRAALLGLKEDGSLNEMQYRYAEERLQQQYRADIAAALTEKEPDA